MISFLAHRASCPFSGFQELLQLSARAVPETLRTDRRPSMDKTKQIQPTAEDFFFAHERLDVFWVSLEMVSLARRVGDQVPRGFRYFADQLLRSAGSVPGNVSEGANRRALGLKRQRFQDALSECGELAGWCTTLKSMRLVCAKDADDLRLLAGRVSAMLNGLLRRLGS
jgi:four helix bundle protein